MAASALPDGPVAVIGAGIAGLAAARALVERGREVVVFDKGRGPGGRASSRRAAPFAFDHGAQYLTARDPRFRRVVAAWEAAGVAARWDGRIATLADGRAAPLAGEAAATERFVGTPRMSAIARHLARGLDLRSGVRVAAAERTADGWTLTDADGGALGAFARLVVTAPPAQAAALIGAASPLGARAAALALRPCWAVLLGLESPYDVPFDGAFCTDEALAWVARDSSKPGRPAAEAWVLHASPAWSAAHEDDAPERVIASLARALARAADAPLPPIAHRDAHRWAYALPDPALEEGALVDAGRGLALAGDAYRGGRVEGAYRSGIAAAERLP